MDRWTTEFEPDDTPKFSPKNLGLAGMAIIGAFLAVILLFTDQSASRDVPRVQLSNQLLTAIEQVVFTRSPALQFDGRLRLVARKQLAAMDLRARLGPMAAQEPALFALLNGHLDAGQGALNISTPEDLEIAASFARLRLDYGLAVQLYSRAIAQSPEHAAILRPMLADTLTEQGLVGGLASPLQDAVALYRDKLLPNAADNAARAQLYNSLGIALQGLARATQDVTTLENAAIAYTDSLRAMADRANTAQIAATQTNLASVLFELSALEPSLALLQGAEAALRDAMQVGPADMLPYYQRQLAAVLLSQADGNGVPIRLDEVAPLLQAAFAPGAPETSTANHVAIMMDYGDALAELGEANADTEFLARAASAYGEALTLVSEQTQPLIWAALQANLGTVYAGMAAMEPSDRAFQDATTAFKAALTIYATHNANIDWALTQNNLALTLESQAARIGDTNILNEAMRRYAAALDKLEGVDETLAAQVRYNLSMAEVRTVELQLRMGSNN